MKKRALVLVASVIALSLLYVWLVRLLAERDLIEAVSGRVDASTVALTLTALLLRVLLLGVAPAWLLWVGVCEASGVWRRRRKGSEPAAG